MPTLSVAWVLCRTEVVAAITGAARPEIVHRFIAGDAGQTAHMVGMNITKRPEWLVPGTPVVEFYSNPSSARSIYRRGVIATVSGNEVAIKGGNNYQFNVETGNVEVRDIGITGLVLQPANGSEVRTARKLNFYSRVGVRFLIAGGRIDQLYDAITE